MSACIRCGGTGHEPPAVNRCPVCELPVSPKGTDSIRTYSGGLAHDVCLRYAASQRADAAAEEDGVSA